jgi:hypothetical protein
LPTVLLLLLLAIAWLAVVIVIVAACQAAARGDARRARTDADAPELLLEQVLVRDGSAADALSSSYRSSRLRNAGRTRALRRGLAPRRRHASRGVR